MPILGLFPTSQERRYSRLIDDMYRGRGPSLAREQLEQGLRKTNAAMTGLAATNRANPELAMRQAMEAGRLAAGDVNAQAAAMRQDEALRAMAEKRRIAEQEAAGINNAFLASAGLLGSLSTAGMQPPTPQPQFDDRRSPNTSPRFTLLSDEREKTRVADGSDRVRRFLDQYRDLQEGGKFYDQLGERVGAALQRSVPEAYPRRMLDDYRRLLDSAEFYQDLGNRVGAALRGSLPEAFRGVQPVEYEYRDPQARGAAPGRRLGVMAQQLRRSDLGRQITREGDDGRLRLDVPGAVSAVMATQADLDNRLRRVEARRNMLRAYGR